jgi:tetratricopeptide (TPR) repeat protein
MQAFVYSDKSLERYAGRFVWLSLNTENTANAKFLQRYPIPALPTILVLDAKRDDVTLRYVGGASVPQLRKMLDDAEKTYGARAQSSADTLLAKADSLAAAGKHDLAAKAFDDALAAAPKSWPKFGRTAESLTFSLSMASQDERCAIRSFELYPRVRGTASAANVATTGLSCATELDAAHPRRKELVTALEKASREVFDDKKITMAADDRSGLYMALIDARKEAKDEAGAKELETEWSAFLDGEAAKAKTAEQRAVFDPHRLSAYIAVGTPEKAIPMLEQSEREFPEDYNPPARLAYAYKAMKEYDQALAASERALARVYGPRKLQVLTMRVDLFLAKDDKKAARETLQQAIDFAKSLPEGQRNDRRIAGFEKRLAEIQ